MRNTFRVLFYIKRTAPRRNGDVPVMARITINGERAQLAVRAYVDPALWDVRTGLAAGRSAAASELNEKLLLVRRKRQNDRRTRHNDDILFCFIRCG